VDSVVYLSRIRDLGLFTPTVAQARVSGAELLHHSKVLLKVDAGGTKLTIEPPAYGFRRFSGAIKGLTPNESAFCFTALHLVLAHHSTSSKAKSKKIVAAS
jgi:hypothetical protein